MMCSVPTGTMAGLLLALLTQFKSYAANGKTALTARSRCFASSLNYVMTWNKQNIA